MRTHLSVVLLVAALTATTASTAHAGCPSTGATLLTTAAQATEGFQARDAAAVESSVDQLRQDLLCAVTILDPAQAAAVHRAYALQAFLAGNTSQTRIAFAAARAADSRYQLPTDFVPTGHPLRQAFDDADAGTASPPQTQALAQRANQRMWVDGKLSTARSIDRPALIQADLTSGVVIGSVYLLPGDDLPSWAIPSGGTATPPAIVEAAPPEAAPPEDTATAAETAAAETAAAETAAAETAAAETAAAETAASAAKAQAKVAKEQAKAQAKEAKLSDVKTTDQLAADKTKKTRSHDKSAHKGPSKGLLWTGVSLGVAAAGLWGGTVLDGNGYQSQVQDARDADYRNQDDLYAAQADIEARAQRVNVLGYAAQATSATAGVLLVAAFVF